ncbi:aminotransferase class III-fold pyridoxal phosphate-dependent enzyme [Legionella septentrionalis]|uniref:aminotransferase class III-fold pyridoxal phosphate-dependent enzyme n=1 Tax=Legionella septentrionalis TaxID=2498109 RepID=UPI000F8D806C|nr:aminotransferase class III-fold pyridoxal phosphate-dependent enzyme [Legionella septentrionalis]RUQ94638.1 aminotransferase class III-fold pyridoxal phosphate-dependent enzyme [Legionella septentrionalis]
MNLNNILEDLKTGKISAHDAFQGIKKLQDKMARKDILNPQPKSHLVKKILTDILYLSSTDDIPDNSSLTELGFDSISLQQLVIKIEEIFAIQIHLSKFVYEITTVKQLTEFITILDQEKNQHISNSASKKDLIKESKRTWVLSDNQQKFLNNFFDQFIKKTIKSYESAQSERLFFADMRLAHFYAQEFKPIWYQLVARCAAGIYITDIDGNQYIDMAGDFGANLFGHGNKEIIEPVINQMISAGGALSFESSLLNETARLFCELTGNERVTFCQSGSESVMIAVRIARAFTSKKQIVLFKGSYHGLTDGLMVNGSENYQAKPKYLGITEGTVQDVICLPYNIHESLQFIKKNAQNLAAILVEPVQSRFPDIQPREFLNELRELCTQHQIVLIFDEMITGFRVHPKGAQGIFDVKPDITTYGKIVCGGFTGGIIAGKAKFMSIVDGGQWVFNDESIPSNKTTFMGATHTHNPYKIAATYAILKKVKALGESFYQELNQKTARLVERLNQMMSLKGAPIKVVYFGSLFRFRFESEEVGAVNFFHAHEKTLFGKLLQFHGIHYLHQGNCFITSAHTSDDLEQFYLAVERSIDILIQEGFIQAKKVDKVNSSLNLIQPLSYEQRAVWFNSKLEKDYCIDTIPICLSFKDIDPAVAEKAIRELAYCQPMLRNTIGNKFSYELKQQVMDIDSISIQLTPIEIYKGAKSTLIDKIKQYARIPIDLSKGPTFKVKLYQYKKEYLLVFVFHHLFVDGESVNIFINAFLNNYEQLKLNSVSDRKLLVNTGYAQYIANQKIKLTPTFIQQAVEFWLPTFEKIKTPLNLPIDFSSNNLALTECCSFEFSKDFSNNIKNFCKENSLSLFNFITCLFGLFIARETQENNFLIVFPTNPKDRFTNYKDVIGHFINQMPLAFEIEPSANLHEFFSATKKKIFECLEYQALPFSLMVEKLKLSGKINKLLRVAINIDLPFSLNNNLQSFKQAVGLDYVPIFNHTGNTDLGCIINENNQTIGISFSYNTHLFKSETAQMLLDSFKDLIASVINKDAKQLPISQIIKKDYVPMASLIQRLEVLAVKQSSLIAIEYNKKEYNYQTLNSVANQLARFLLNRIEKTDTTQPVIALCFQRSSQYIFALLACIKMRAIFLPIDPNWPTERKLVVLNDAQCDLLIHDGIQQDELVKLNINAINYELADFASYDDSNLEAMSYSVKDNLYIIYTSGSTGQPKGVVINHEGLVNTLNYSLKMLSLSHNDKILQFSSIAFDASIWEIFTAILSGARLIITAPQDILPGEILNKTLRNYAITTALLPPCVLLATPSSDLPNVTKIIAGGENFSKNILNKWYSQKRQIFNAYGPTEASILCMLTSPLHQNSPVPLGRVIDNMEVAIFDDHFNQTNVGELYLAGIGLSPFYWNNDELTKKYFVTVNNKRYFKTGDKVEINSEGYFFLGRLDQTVKIRGNRIDLGEIEWHLNHFSEIEQAIVIAEEGSYSTLTLVAFFIHNPSSTTEDVILSVRKKLAQKVPDYMIPTHFFAIDKFPITINGKIDLHGLRYTVNNLSAENQPDNQLKAIWSSIFQIEPSKITDSSDFFDMGGNSLIVVHLVDEIHKFFPDKSISIADIFEYSTFGDIAKFVYGNGKDTVTDNFSISTAVDTFFL